MNISFRLKPGRDNEIIDWVNTLGDKDRSYFIREALKFYICQGGSKHNMALPPNPPYQSRSFDIEKSLNENPDVRKDEKPLKNSDLDSILDDWADSV